MSVLIKGMEIPDTCLHCPFADGEYGWCDVDNSIGMHNDERPTDCPLVALPDHHGRLMDADALRESVLKWLPHDPCGVEENEHPYETDICVSMLMEIEDAPTIVDLEGENANYN